MGKKKVTYDLNDANKPPNHVAINNHRHHHHHHRHNHQKPKKIKSEARLLHTLNSHFKKLAKCRSRKVTSILSPRASVSPKYNKHHNDHISFWLKLDNKDDCHDWFTSSDFGHDDAYRVNGGYDGQELCLKTMSFLEQENNEDLFGGDCVFGPDFSASHDIMVVIEEDGYGSYMPDLVMKLDNGDESKYLYDVLELSSEEDMINEFLKANLFVS